MSTPLGFLVDDQFLDELAERIDTEGVACIKNGVNSESLMRWQKQLDVYLEKQGQRYFSMIQPWQEPNSSYGELARDDNFKRLLSGLTLRGAPGRKAEGSIYNVLRVVAGAKGSEKSMMFHYDASVVTVLIPLQIPEGSPEDCGDLVAFPNARPIRRSSLLNALEKLLVQNPISRRIMAQRIKKRSNDENIFRLSPGDIYVFWGYRTLHANLSCKPHSLRATLLFHHGDPHLGSLTTRFIKWTRRVRERHNLKARF
ncbi:hypothetical protein [Roseateles cavernae]|uniref:hypothetical protein n=1 Tax=Roseateles cavernae TaxID=3153578 RepID=UPI0032E3A784